MRGIIGATQVFNSRTASRKRGKGARNIFSNTKTLAILTLLVAILFTACGSVEAQQTGSEYRYLRYARQYARFAIHCGRTTMVPLKTHSFTPRATEDGNKKEQVAVHYNQHDGSMRIHYDRTTPEEKLLVSAETSGRIVVRREAGEKGDVVPSEFVQDASGPFTLTFGKDGEKKTFTAPTLWHLLLAHPEPCKEYVLPYLRLLRSDWRLGKQAERVEEELLRAAKDGKLPDRRRWAEWVAQLGDEKYARREAADRALRALGQPVVPYLRNLRRDRLDAEQQFRIHRIIESLSSTLVDETPRQVAHTMLIDPMVWLVLLDRDSLATRQLAAKHLARLLEKPIDFDPLADVATRRRQIEALRRKLAGSGR